jgi:hypothetical protein
MLGFVFIVVVGVALALGGFIFLTADEYFKWEKRKDTW